MQEYITTRIHTLSSHTHSEPNLSFSGDCARGDSHCVDPSVSILVDLNVRFLLSGFHIPRGVKEVKHFLIIQLQNQEERLIMLF